MGQPARPSRRRSGSLIEPTLGWTYLSREALPRAEAQMDEESMCVRDEIGFLTIHRGYADSFFLGTSVLHTRARYAVIVPWQFEDLAGLRARPQHVLCSNGSGSLPAASGMRENPKLLAAASFVSLR